MEKSPKYLDPRTLARLQGLELRARSIVEGYVAGLHRSPFHGFSIEFAEHREYVPGDDLRYVDWKVFGKTDKVYLKQYEQETNLVAYLLLDTSESMHYQSDPLGLSKLEYAKCIAASLAYLVLRQQDSVGLATFDHEIRALVRPSGNPTQLKQILHVMEDSSAEKKTATGRIFHDLAERLSMRGIVLVLSDLFDDPFHDDGLKALSSPTSRRGRFSHSGSSGIGISLSTNHVVQRAGRITGNGRRPTVATKGLLGRIRAILERSQKSLSCEPCGLRAAAHRSAVGRGLE